MKSPQYSKFRILNQQIHVLDADSTQKGSVLLIAILVSSVALAVGLGVFNRTYKELLFASFWKQTQVAFFAADSGLECALHWQLNPGSPASCFGSNILGWTPPNLIPAPGIDIDVNGIACVNLQITTDGIATTTTVRGYNDVCGSTNPRRVERGLRVSI